MRKRHKALSHLFFFCFSSICPSTAWASDNNDEVKTTTCRKQIVIEVEHHRGIGRVRLEPASSVSLKLLFKHFRGLEGLDVQQGATKLTIDRLGKKVSPDRITVIIPAKFVRAKEPITIQWVDFYR